MKSHRSQAFRLWRSLVNVPQSRQKLPDFPNLLKRLMMNLANGDREKKRQALVINNQKMEPEELRTVRKSEPDLEKVSAGEHDPNLIERWENNSAQANAPVYVESQLPNPLWEQQSKPQPFPVKLGKIAWMIAAITIFGLGGSVLSQIETTIEQVISAPGQLKAHKAVREIQAPRNRVVKEIYVKNGDRVDKGQPLVGFDAQNSYEQLKSLENNRQFLRQQNRFYQTVMEDLVDKTQLESKIVPLKLSKEAAFLLKNRVALLETNHLLQAQLKTDATNLKRDNLLLSPPSNRNNSLNHLAHVNSAIEQLQKRLKQNQAQLYNAQQNLKLEQVNQAKIQLLVKEGAISELEYTQRQQKMRFQEAEVAQLGSEQQQLKLSIEQIQEQLAHLSAAERQPAIAAPMVNYQKQITDNQKQIAEIDSQLTKMSADNEKQIAQIDRQISRTKQASNYPTLRAPVAGTVFDLQATPQSTSHSKPTQALLKLMSDERYLIAEVFIPKQDVDFVWKGMKVTLKFDSLPLGESGYISGTLVTIGSDALPPDESHSFYRLPAKVSLDRQTLVINNKEISFQSGMPVTINIKVREKRTLLEAILQK